MKYRIVRRTWVQHLSRTCEPGEVVELDLAKVSDNVEPLPAQVEPLKLVEPKRQKRAA